MEGARNIPEDLLANRVARKVQPHLKSLLPQESLRDRGKSGAGPPGKSGSHPRYVVLTDDGRRTEGARDALWLVFGLTSAAAALAWTLPRTYVTRAEGPRAASAGPEGSETQATYSTFRNRRTGYAESRKPNF